MSTLVFKVHYLVKGTNAIAARSTDHDTYDEAIQTGKSIAELHTVDFIIVREQRDQVFEHRCL